MDCREFRDRHSLFVDLMCSAFDENEMRDHVRICPDCSRHDTVIRRSLMLVRSLPTIEPSPDFQARLQAQLRAIALAPASTSARQMRPSYRAFAAVAAGVVFVTYIAADLVRRTTAHDVQMTPVVATLPELEPSQAATPAMVAAVPTGMSVWPAIMLAGQTHMHFVAAELASER